FFQAEDGIRDYLVTGVQTCALPILAFHKFLEISAPSERFVFLDEHEDSIGDGWFFVSVQSEWPNTAWDDIPGSRHGGGCDLSFEIGRASCREGVWDVVLGSGRVSTR